MLNNKEKQCIIDILTSDIDDELQAVYIFGSQNDGTATGKSDVDIAYLSKKTLSNVKRWDVSQKLTSSLSKDVDLIELATTNTIFRYQILSKGSRIYGEGYEVESFETLAYSCYLRATQERKPIVEEIMKNKSVLGTVHV